MEILHAYRLSHRQVPHLHLRRKKISYTFIFRLLTHFRFSGNTDVSPVGAVNAGLLTSSALTARQASVPLLAIAGLVSVLGLL